MKEMIAYCGLDCEKCDAYIATINNDNVLRENTAKLWAEMNNAPITSAMINCMGCRADGVKTPFCESMCDIRKCALNKGVNTCGDCSKIKACETVGQILNNSEEAREKVKDNNVDSSIAFLFACPGEKEKTAKKVLAGATGNNLNILLRILNGRFPLVFTSTCRYDYKLINASEKVYYKGYINKRTLPYLKDDVYLSDNIRRLNDSLSKVKCVICFGVTAKKAIKRVQKNLKSLNVISAKYHLGFLGINHISKNISGVYIEKGDPDATFKRIEVIADEIIKQINLIKNL